MNKWDPFDFGFPILIVEKVCHWQIDKPQQQGHYAGDQRHDSKSLDRTVHGVTLRR